MKTGDKVICRGSRGYDFTTGKEYVILEFIDRTPMENGFVFPEYVVVTDDCGKQVHCHAHRFVLKDQA